MIAEFFAGYVDAFNWSLGEKYEIFVLVTGDEIALYQEHGFLPDSDAA